MFKLALSNAHNKYNKNIKVVTMYFAAALLVALVVTLLSVSKIAKMLNAKNHEIGSIFGAFIVGGIFAIISIISLNMLGLMRDPNVMMAVTFIVAFIVASSAYKYINKLSWGGAFTLNTASLAIGSLTMVAAIVLSGESMKDSLDFINITAKNNLSAVESMVGKNTVQTPERAATAATAAATTAIKEDTSEVLEPVITELDLLPARAVRHMKKKEKKVYIEPKFRVVSIGNIHSAVGHKVRIHRKNGNTVMGGLKSVAGGDVVISRYTNRGTVVMPISIAKIHKVEVYK